jgi:hypothetical protein
MKITLPQTDEGEQRIIADIQIPKALLQTANYVRIGEYAARAMADAWADAKGFPYDSPPVLNYYAGILDWITLKLKEMFVNRFNALQARRTKDAPLEKWLQGVG